MYIGLTRPYAEIDRNDQNITILYYRVSDSTFQHDFSATYFENVRGALEDIRHLDQMITGIYYAYKFSNQPICQNFKLVLQKTFPSSLLQIKKTQFYRAHKSLIDKNSEERKPDVIKY